MRSRPLREYILPNPYPKVFFVRAAVSQFLRQTMPITPTCPTKSTSQAPMHPWGVQTGTWNPKGSAIAPFLHIHRVCFASKVAKICCGPNLGSERGFLAMSSVQVNCTNQLGNSAASPFLCIHRVLFAPSFAKICCVPNFGSEFPFLAMFKTAKDKMRQPTGFGARMINFWYEGLAKIGEMVRQLLD